MEHCFVLHVFVRLPLGYLIQMLFMNVCRLVLAECSLRCRIACWQVSALSFCWQVLFGFDMGADLCWQSDLCVAELRVGKCSFC